MSTVVPRPPGRQPPSMRSCPRCGGTGRVGKGREPCRACWCSGAVEAWKWQQLVDEDARRGGAAARTGAGEADEPEEPVDVAQLSGRAGIKDLCLKCAPTERCQLCPFEPFVLAA
jgi:DnaJ-class molecular chaperone